MMHFVLFHSISKTLTKKLVSLGHKKKEDCSLRKT